MWKFTIWYTLSEQSSGDCARCQCAIVFFRLSLSLFLQLHCRQCLSFYYATAMYYFTPNKGAVCCLYARCAQGARDSSTGVRRRGGLAWLVALLLTHLCYNDGSQEIQQLSKAHLNSRTLYYYLLVENTTYLAHLYSSKERTTFVPFWRKKPEKFLK